MKYNENQNLQPNADAPPELAQFTFLFGKWRCEVILQRDDGTWESLRGAWEGEYILDRYAIADEYRITTPSGQLLVLGVNMRMYDAKKKIWNMKWLQTLAGTWVDLGPEELGGVKVDGKAITYIMKEPLAAHAALVPLTQTSPKTTSHGGARDRTTVRSGRSTW